ncbi:uncharacterized protein EV154DRAFT_515560 [Mucor mucedo]|uniref:uncharacterized protein n=1 Tax=Mucor mucedo TaxID=29922 RepID=UPI0022201869|nr:uncharacterized protein EV154DRAFT_515560 [Mucor mucedo]KAI7889151.1 hypothetical protein EV154DRAFT_515560 [Mucor mucedo]
MSLDIDWSKLDDTLAGHVQQFLNKHFQAITKPSFIGDIEVTSFNWGNETPQVEIINITDPFPEFYEEEEGESTTPAPKSVSSPSTIVSVTPSLPPSEFFSDDGVGYNAARFSLNTPLSQQQRFNLIHSFHRSPFVAPQHPFNSSPVPALSSLAWQSRPPSVAEEDWIDDEEINPNISSLPPTSHSSSDKESTEMDFQVHMLISYKGDMNMTIVTELRMNYPSVMFMSLPINLNVKAIEFEATAVVAYIQSMNRVCVSMLEPEDTGIRKDIGMDSLLRNVHIETIVGDEQKQGKQSYAYTHKCM